MPEMVEISKRLVLRYEPGQFTFRRFDALATDENLFELAHQLNSFQEDEVRQIVKIQVRQFM